MVYAIRFSDLPNHLIRTFSLVGVAEAVGEFAAGSRQSKIHSLLRKRSKVKLFHIPVHKDFGRALCVLKTLSAGDIGETERK